MRIGRLYPAAVALVVEAMLGAVSVGWGTLGATEDNPNSAWERGSAPTGGEGTKQTPQGKQTPLLMRVLDPPQPVKGTDGKYHLVYELVLTNSSPGTATVESVNTMDPKSGEVVDTLAGAEIAARTTLLNGSLDPAQKIGSAQVATLYLDATFEDRREVPKEIEHRVKTSFDLPPGALFPEATTDVGARTGYRTRSRS